MATRGRKLLNLIGQRYGRLVVASRLGKVDGYRCWWCCCDCGAQDVIVRQDLLRKGTIQSCGCLRREKMQSVQSRLGAVRLLRSEGLTMQEIGERLGITKQRVHQLLQEGNAAG
jgi:hypothetical protein